MKLRILLLVIVTMFSLEAIGAAEDFLVSVETDKTHYKAGDEAIINFTITNQSSESIQIYLLNTFMSSNYLSIQNENGEELPQHAFARYMWEEPTFHLIEPGEVFAKELKALVTSENTIKFEDKELKFQDVVYALSAIDSISLKAVFRCDEQMAQLYQKKYQKELEKKFWVGEVSSETILIKFD